MPVNILYCEGVAKSADVRVISAIVPPGCLVRPIGSKQGLAQRILGAKDIRTGSTVAGLRDRDFDKAILLINIKQQQQKGFFATL